MRKMRGNEVIDDAAINGRSLMTSNCTAGFDSATNIQADDKNCAGTKRTRDISIGNKEGSNDVGSAEHIARAAERTTGDECVKKVDAAINKSTCVHGSSAILIARENEENDVVSCSERRLGLFEKTEAHGPDGVVTA